MTDSSGHSLDPLKVREALRVAVAASREAGREILQVYRRDFAVDTKEGLTPITEADRRAHQGILRRLAAASPDPILSEEGRDIPFEERRGWDVYWLVDPLDGTKEFVKRNGEFTVNIALMDGDGPVLGVVYAPVLEVLYFAWRGGGAHRLRGLPAAANVAELLESAETLSRRGSLELDEVRPHDRVIVMASRSHRGPAFERYVRELRRYAGEVEIRSLGSALKPCVIAAGEADIYPRFGRTMEWDTAAAHAVVREVGKRMVTIEAGRELIYNKPELVNPSFLVL